MQNGQHMFLRRVGLLLEEAGERGLEDAVRRRRGLALLRSRSGPLLLLLLPPLLLLLLLNPVHHFK